MKVVVTGANGFIGKYVVARLVKEGHKVIGIGRNEVECEFDNYHFCKVDIVNEESINVVFENFKGVDGIVHLAADLDMQGSSQTITTNCLGTFLLARKAVEKGMKFFINISSIPVIGKPTIIPITEEHPTCPETLYHITKLTSEQIVNTLCNAHMRTYNLRISSPIGIGMSSKNFLSVIMNKCKKNESIEIYGQGTRVQNYIDVRDVAEAVLLAIKSERHGLYLVAGQTSISNIELVKKCIHLLHSKSEIIVGQKADREEDNRWYISAEKISKELEFVPRYSLDDTISWINHSLE